MFCLESTWFELMLIHCHLAIWLKLPTLWFKASVNIDTLFFFPFESDHPSTLNEQCLIPKDVPMISKTIFMKFFRYLMVISSTKCQAGLLKLLLKCLLPAKKGVKTTKHILIGALIIIDEEPSLHSSNIRFSDLDIPAYEHLENWLKIIIDRGSKQTSPPLSNCSQFTPLILITVFVVFLYSCVNLGVLLGFVGCDILGKASSWVDSKVVCANYTIAVLTGCEVRIWIWLHIKKILLQTVTKIVMNLAIKVKDAYLQKEQVWLELYQNSHRRHFFVFFLLRVFQTQFSCTSDMFCS